MKTDILPLEEKPPGQWFEEVRQRAEKEADVRSLELTEPGKAAMVLEMLSRRDSVLQISKKTGVSRHLIRKLRWRHGETLESRRKEMAQKMAMAAEETTELYFKKIEMMDDDDDMLAQTSLKDLALSNAIFTDKAMQLSGMATAVIEHRRGPSIEDAQAAIAEARARIANRATEHAIEVEVID